MACSSSVIPRSAVELLFAEDLIKRIMHRHTGEQFKTWRAAPYRDFIFNAFNDDIGQAVDFIDMMLEWEVDEAFSAMVDGHRVDRDAFINYALHFEGLCFKQGFDADNFLNFCVRLVSMAVYFDQYGVSLALELALFFVVKVMTNFDLFEGGWDTLNAVAKKYVERKEDFYRVLTPDVSDDEPLMNALENDAADEVEINEEDGFAISQEEQPKESNCDMINSSGLKSELPLSSEKMAEGYIISEEDSFGVNNDKKLKDESDRQRTDLPGSKLDIPASSENKAVGCILNVDYKSATFREEKLQNKPENERMDSSGSKLDLHPCSEREEQLKN